MIRLFHSLTTLLMIGLITGCANFDFKGLSDFDFKDFIKPVERKVIDNSIYSNKYPNAVIKVSGELSYEGMVPQSFWQQFVSSAGGSIHNGNTYFFISSDKNKMLDRWVSVGFWRIQDGYWIPGFDRKGSVQMGKSILNGERFDTAIQSHTVNRNNMTVQYLEDSGVILPSCKITKKYKKLYDSGRGQDHNLLIEYAEPFECGKKVMFLDANMDTQRTKNFLKAFNRRAEEAFKFIRL